MAKKITPYLIQCITNLHMGSGDTEYGIIDKTVQRDSVHKYPVIHGSGIKGALRNHFKEGSWKDAKEKINKVFGKDGQETETGTHIFTDAHLVFLPLRCTHNQFAFGFDKIMAELINEKTRLFTLSDSPFFNSEISTSENFLYTETEVNDIFIEDYKLKRKDYKFPLNIKNDSLKINFHQFASLKPDNFSKLVKNLPVIARNRVGENKNLWYEEVVPHQTLFLTFIGDDEEGNKDFEEELLKGPIQIGANASVGFGYCKFHKIELKDE